MRKKIYGTMVSSGLVVDGNPIWDIQVYSGGVLKKSTVTQGEINIGDGGSGVNLTAKKYGGIEVDDGGKVTSMRVSSGGEAYINSGAVVNKLYWTPGVGHVNIEYGAKVSFASAVTGVYYAKNDKVLSKTASMNNKAVADDVNMYVMSKGVARGTVLKGDDCSLDVYSGGSVYNTTIRDGGSMYVYGGAVADTVKVSSGGELEVTTGAAVTGINVLKGGEMEIAVDPLTRTQGKFNGKAFDFNGRVDNFTISKGMDIELFSGAVATKTKVLSGGELNVEYGAKATGITVSKGGALVFQVAKGTVFQGTSAGKAFKNSNGYMSGFTIGKDCEVLVDGGKVVKTTVGSDAWLEIEENGVASSTTVKSGGGLEVDSGKVVNTTIGAGGFMQVTDGGTVSGKLSLNSTASVWFEPDATLDFTVANRKTTDGYLVNNFRMIENYEMNFSITVKSAQAAGTYRLASGGTGSYFDKKYTFGTNGKNYGTLTLNKDKVKNGKTYDLVKSGSNLLLKVINGAADLKITALSVSDLTPTTADKVKFTIKVKNVGNAASKASRVYIYEGTKKLAGVLTAAQGAGVTKSYTVTLSASKLSAGSHSVFAKIDALNEVAESNENNNKTQNRVLKVSAAKSSASAALTPEWNVVAYEDVNNDGFADLLLGKDTGLTGWEKPSAGQLDELSSLVGDEWKFGGIADWNNDSADELLLKGCAAALKPETDEQGKILGAGKLA